LRGAGRSYGDASILSEALVVDISRMRRILHWCPKTGVVDAEGGVTIEDLWRLTLEDGWWPPVVSGTMFPTLAGALGMNIHGKNNPQVGTLGEQVLELDVALPTGELRTLTPKDPYFYAVISGFGMLGAIVRVKLQMKRVHSGNLHVLALNLANWDAQFEAFEKYVPIANYQVSWVDFFARGKGFGRGNFHAAWYADEGSEHPPSLNPDSQDLPDTIMGFFPKSIVWKFLKPMNNRPGMRFVNAAKQKAGGLGDGRPATQSLVAFSFLLDYVPNWRNAYLPGGFIQYQSFVPYVHAPRVFARQVELQQEAHLESFLGVMKRHRPDKFLFSHAVDGYSLAMDFKVTAGNKDRLYRLAHQMNDIVLEAGGRFYLAKDSTLRPSDVAAYMGVEKLDEYRRIKRELDPEQLLSSALAHRLGL
jgi:decaprenylphospho-beta-D-ribofuranose 2-oxidase